MIQSPVILCYFHVPCTMAPHLGETSCFPEQSHLTLSFTFTLHHTATKIGQQAEFLLEIFGFCFFLLFVFTIRSIACFQLEKTIRHSLDNLSIRNIRLVLQVEIDSRAPVPLARRPTLPVLEIWLIDHRVELAVDSDGLLVPRANSRWTSASANTSIVLLQGFFDAKSFARLRLLSSHRVELEQCCP